MEKLSFEEYFLVMFALKELKEQKQKNVTCFEKTEDDFYKKRALENKKDIEIINNLLFKFSQMRE